MATSETLARHPISRGRRRYSPDAIDDALVSTILMVNQGKIVVWQGSRMYLTREGCCINSKVVGDVVDAVFLWFDRYSAADPYEGGWGSNPTGPDLLKRRFAPTKRR
jgi:hypothetical protein